MPYSEEQKKRFQTMPANIALYDTVSFENINAEPVNILVSGKNGPYKSKFFTVDSVLTEFTPTTCEIPQVTNQAEDNNLGSVSFGRIGSQVFSFLDAINSGANTPAEAVIKVTLRRWESGVTDPIFTRVCYVNTDGVTIQPNAVSVDLAVDNPALVTAVPFYDPVEYPGLSYSDQA